MRPVSKQVPRLMQQQATEICRRAVVQVILVNVDIGIRTASALSVVVRVTVRNIRVAAEDSPCLVQCAHLRVSLGTDCNLQVHLCERTLNPPLVNFSQLDETVWFGVRTS